MQINLGIFMDKIGGKNRRLKRSPSSELCYEKIDVLEHEDRQKMSKNRGRD